MTDADHQGIIWHALATAFAAGAVFMLAVVAMLWLVLHLSGKL